MSTPHKTCPECGGTERFYHCSGRCRAPTHVVTCLRCKTCYLTEVKP